ncbi:MAG: fumarylacetoacetate hydrolase family protein [Deltaproteobacteria bacterium]|nr:fumarylacetoacetate hydrolase family protein [Deltaproteobacteria bacterium]
MKIAQFYDNNDIRLGLIHAERLIPIDFDGDMIDLIKYGQPSETRGKPISFDQVKWAPVVTRPSKIIAIGLNYKDHAEESKGKLPEAPLVFAKFPNSLIGQNDEITWDANVTGKVDFEAELAVIIGKKTRDCPESEAMGAVFGYTCANDVSARDLQFGDGQWVRGKSLDTFCPLGPWIVTADELPDPHSLKIRCWLNGRLMQDSHTDLLIFKVPELISFLSRHFTLFPGDIILTGTPSGVGAFRNPSVYMKDGDEVVVEIGGVGRLVNTCRT